MSLDLDNAFRVLERELGERLGIKLQITQSENDTKIGVTARLWEQHTFVVEEPGVRASPHQVFDLLFEACQQAKLGLVSKVFEKFLSLNDQERGAEQRQFTNAAYLYRTRLMELQPAWERLKKCPAGSAAAELAQRDYDSLKIAAENARKTLIRLAAGGLPEDVE